MARKIKDIFPRTRKAMICLVCEGRNKTERTYFNHFNERYTNYVLRIYDCEATDVIGLGKRGQRIWKDQDLDKMLGDRVYCLFDIDLNGTKLEQLEIAQKRYPNISFIPSNPCFEAWLLFYFTEHPKRVASSKDEKEQMKQYIPNYTESTDVLACPSVADHLTAVNRARANNKLQQDIILLDKNPYTEIPDVVLNLLAWKEVDGSFIEKVK